MTADYDVVVIGGSNVARYVAQQSAHTGARVALVIDDGEGDRAERQSNWCHQGLREAAHRMQQAAQLGELVTVRSASVIWDWGKHDALSDEQERSLSGLAVQGVDVVEAPAEFRRRPQVAVVAGGRTLRSRRYVIATGTEPYCPPLSGIETVPYDTRRSLWATPPKFDADSPWHWVLIGTGAIAVELAQALHWCHQSVTVIAPGGLLPDQDAELVNLLVAHLEAEGVQVLTAVVDEICPGASTRPIQVKCAGQTISSDRLVVLEEQPRVRSLNLAALGISWTFAGIDVSFGSQTPHPTVFAINGSTDSPIAYANADGWLSQQLGLGDRGAGLPVIPVQTSPPLARIGETEAQAQQTLGAAVRVWTSAHPGQRDRLVGNTTCFTKLLTRPNGQVIGAHLLGHHANDLQAVAIAMHHRQPLPITLPPTTPLGSLIRLVWQQQRSLWHRVRRWWLNLCDRLLP